MAADMNGRQFLLACVAMSCCAVSISSYGQSNEPAFIVPHPPVPVSLPVVVHPATIQQGTPPNQIPDSMIAWDSVNKDTTVPSGSAEAKFEFNLTNIASGPITITSVATSCGCTVAKLPAQPWYLAPGSNGQISVTMNVLNKTGRITKIVTVNSDKGTKMLLVNTTILPGTGPAAGGMGDRERNQQIATADRQAVFRGDCARCHVQPAQGKYGKDLYVAACGVCHESDHRATMVQNLHAIPQETNADFWRNWITNGKIGTLMPAFAQAQGGPLSDAQIGSLVQYLVVAIPSKAPVRPNSATR